MHLRGSESLGISVVVCCYNSASRIVPTLEHLANQIGVPCPWEVLLIDNNSSDATTEVALTTWKKLESPCELRIVHEPKPGTMFARRKGIFESNFRYLLFCDDDNWLNDAYLKTAFDVISTDKNIAAVGGLGILEFEPQFVPPVWATRFQNTFGAGPQGKDDGDTTFSKGCLYTAGAMLDRRWLGRLYSLGFESSLKGRDGKSLVAGEDTELTYALKLIGGRLYYSSRMHFRHFMPNGRITWKYMKRMWEAFGYSDFLISPYKMAFGFRSSSNQIIVILSRCFWIIKYFISASPQFEPGNINVLKLFRTLGQLRAALFDFDVFRRNRRMVAMLKRKIND